jgi:hypothetical protein
MDSIFLHLQNFTLVSYITFGLVLISFFVETKSNSPYKSLLLSNIGFVIYNFTLANGADIDFPIYFILLSFLICSWFFVLKNIEEEEDEDRGYLSIDYSIYRDSFATLQDENKDEISSLKKGFFYIFPNILRTLFAKMFENKTMLFVRDLLKNDTVHYEHPQRKFVYVSTYLVLISILVSFFYV